MHHSHFPHHAHQAPLAHHDALLSDKKVMSDPPTPTPSSPTAIAAAKFIRDLCYDPNLRDAYYAALNLRTVALQQKAIVKLLQKYNANCTYDDLEAGYKVFGSQALLAWQSIYQLKPVDTSSTADQTIHTCMVVGSRTGKSTILFDNKQVNGFTNGFPTTQTISWDSGNNAVNAAITFGYKKITDTSLDPSSGPRVMNATLWKAGDPKPDTVTHIGHDFFEDVAQFNGSYNTIKVDSDSGDEITGPNISIEITQDSTALNEAQVGVNVQQDDPSKAGTKIPVAVATALQSLQNTVHWQATVDDLTGESASWAQGYLNFAWTYKLPVQTQKAGAAASTTEGKLVQQLNGSIWTDDIENSTEINGTIIADTYVDDNDTSKAFNTGLGVSISLFAALVIGIILGVRKLIKSRTKEKENTEKKNEGQDLTDEDIISEKAPIEGAKLQLEMVEKAVSKTVVTDPNDTTTFKNKNDAFGKQEISEGGGHMFENPLDPSGQTAVANRTKPGDSVPIKELVDSSGKSLADVTDIPTLKSPVKDIQTDVTRIVREIGGQLTSSVKIGNINIEEMVTREGGELARDFPTEEFR